MNMDLTLIMDDETWFNAKKAKELGFADKKAKELGFADSILFDKDEDEKKKGPQIPAEPEEGEAEEGAGEGDGGDASEEEEKKKKPPFQQNSMMFSRKTVSDSFLAKVAEEKPKNMVPVDQLKKRLSLLTH